MKNALNVVSSANAPPAPYPADTRAKGWRFELDYERIDQSDTWVLADAAMRPWLLMLGLTAWRQTPCGSLPAQDELIAARIGMDRRTFTANRDILMRGWWLASDGRMYHPVITEQVLALIAMREKEAARKQAWRNKQDQALASKCPTGQPSDYSVTPPSVTAPEPEPEPDISTSLRSVDSAEVSAQPAKPKRQAKPRVKLGADSLLALGVVQQVAEDWLAVRAAKRMPLTSTALEGIQAEAHKAGLDLNSALLIATRRNWGSFDADWLLKSDASRLNSPPPLTPYQRQEEAGRQAREAGDRAIELMANAPPGSPDRRLYELQVKRGAIEPCRKS